MSSGELGRDLGVCPCADRGGRRPCTTGPKTLRAEINLRDDPAVGTPPSKASLDIRQADTVRVGASDDGSVVARGVKEEQHLMVVRKLIKVALFAAYFGLFAVLMVAAGYFVLHG